MKLKVGNCVFRSKHKQQRHDVVENRSIDTRLKIAILAVKSSSWIVAQMLEKTSSLGDFETYSKYSFVVWLMLHFVVI